MSAAQRCVPRRNDAVAASVAGQHTESVCRPWCWFSGVMRGTACLSCANGGFRCREVGRVWTRNSAGQVSLEHCTGLGARDNAGCGLRWAPRPRNLEAKGGALPGCSGGSKSCRENATGVGCCPLVERGAGQKSRGPAVATTKEATSGTVSLNAPQLIGQQLQAASELSMLPSLHSYTVHTLQFNPWVFVSAGPTEILAPSAESVQFLYQALAVQHLFARWCESPDSLLVVNSKSQTSTSSCPC